MSVTASVIDPDLDTSSSSFVESLVARLHLEYGGDPGTIRAQVGDLLGRFAGARVQAFVPILVEKQLRDIYRRSSGRRAPS